MTAIEQIMHDLKEILETVPEVQKVSFGKAMPITIEDTFTAVYVQPATEMFELHTAAKSLQAYDDYILVSLFANINNSTDPLYYLYVKQQLISAILNDSAIWDNLVDRTIRSVAYDDFVNDPLCTIELLFEFRVRDLCP